MQEMMLSLFLPMQWKCQKADGKLYLHIHYEPQIYSYFILKFSAFLSLDILINFILIKKVCMGEGAEKKNASGQARREGGEPGVNSRGPDLLEAPWGPPNSYLKKKLYMFFLIYPTFIILLLSTLDSTLSGGWKSIATHRAPKCLPEKKCTYFFCYIPLHIRTSRVRNKRVGGRNKWLVWVNIIFHLLSDIFIA